METIKFKETETTLVVLPDEVKELALRVPESKQKEVQTVLSQIFAGTADWKTQADSIVVKGIDDKMSIQMADIGRKNVKNARIAAEKIFDAKRDEVQQKKSEFDLEDKLWLKAKQTAQILFKDIENTFEWKAKFAERYEAEQKELTTQLRIEKVSKYTDDINRIALENMSEQIFDIFLSGLEKSYNDRIAAEKKAEDDRLAEIEAERIRQENIRLENEKLKKEAEEEEIERNRLKIERKKTALKFLNQSGFHTTVGGMENKDGDHFIGENHYAEFDTDRELEDFQNRIKTETDQKEKEQLRSKRSEELRPYIIFIRDHNKMISLPEKEYQKELSDIKIGAKEHYEFEAKKAQKKYDEQQIIIAKQADERVHQIEKNRIEREKKAKAKVEKDTKLAPDKDKLLNFMQVINDLQRPEVTSIEAAEIVANVNTFLVKTANYIKENIIRL